MTILYMPDHGERLRHTMFPAYPGNKSNRPLFPTLPEPPPRILQPSVWPDWVTAYDIRSFDGNIWSAPEREIIKFPSVPVCTAGCPNEFPEVTARQFLSGCVFAIQRTVLPAFESYAFAMEHIYDRHRDYLGRARAILYPYADVLMLLPDTHCGDPPGAARLSDLLKQNPALGKQFEYSVRQSGRFPWPADE